MSDYDDLFGRDSEHEQPPMDFPVERRPKFWPLAVLAAVLVAVWLGMKLFLPPVPATYFNLCPPGNTHALCPNRVQN